MHITLKKFLLGVVGLLTITGCHSTTGTHQPVRTYHERNFVGLATMQSQGYYATLQGRPFPRQGVTYGRFSDGETRVICNPVKGAFPSAVRAARGAPSPQTGSEWVWVKYTQAHGRNRGPDGGCWTTRDKIAIVQGTKGLVFVDRRCGNASSVLRDAPLISPASGTWVCPRGTEMRGTGLEGRPGCYKVIRNNWGDNGGNGFNGGPADPGTPGGGPSGGPADPGTPGGGGLADPGTPGGGPSDPGTPT